MFIPLFHSLTPSSLLGKGGTSTLSTRGAGSPPGGPQDGQRNSGGESEEEAGEGGGGGGEGEGEGDGDGGGEEGAEGEQRLTAQAEVREGGTMC